jgi:tol-pal system protein YbgF
LITVVVLSLAAAPSALSAGTGRDQDQREKLDRLAARLEELKTAVQTLAQQARGLQDEIGQTSGRQTTLVMQMIQNLSAIGRAQSAISTNGEDALARLSAIGEQVTALNDQIGRMSAHFAESQRRIGEISKPPAVVPITSGFPEQLFAAAYGDYSRRNYALALSEFRQFLETYRGSDLADNAQYWIGEIFYEQKQFQAAIDAFARVGEIGPRGDKAAPALYRRAMAFEALGRREDAVRQLQTLAELHPKSQEARLAGRQLQEWQ